MQLSVIIVNYNVKYFLEQCLCSVRKSMGVNRQLSMVNGEWSSESYRKVNEKPEVEVFVIDNHSTDGSPEYLQPKFPFVQFIVNTENEGFAKANNRALQQATGKYVLFLNPDTIVPENLFADCIAFMESHPGAGALGVRMIDGSGHYLKESKRGFPTPWVAFCKMSGLTKLFPASKIFARYYLGHLPEKETHEVVVLAGACMLVRKEALDKTGGFDERFFMYAEDIDFSYRIQQAGYKNYYYPDCTIIHFKGESTKKDSRYIQLFYKAMILFVRKHFRGGASRLYRLMLEAGIWLRAGLESIVGSRETGVDSLELIAGSQKSGFFSFVGDEQQVQALKKMLTSTADDTSKKDPKIIVFCEGPSFSFKKIIKELQALPSGKKALIHGCDTRSIAGSGSKNAQGAAFLLPA